MVETKPTDITGGLPLEGFRRLFFVYVLGSKRGIRSIVIHPAMGILAMVHIYIYTHVNQRTNKTLRFIYIYMYIHIHFTTFMIIYVDL